MEKHIIIIIAQVDLEAHMAVRNGGDWKGTK